MLQRFESGHEETIIPGLSPYYLVSSSKRSFAILAVLSFPSIHCNVYVSIFQHIWSGMNSIRQIYLICAFHSAHHDKGGGRRARPHLCSSLVSSGIVVSLVSSQSSKSIIVHFFVSGCHIMFRKALSIGSIPR